MSELESLALSLVGRAERGEDVEAFLTHERTFYVKAYSGEVEALSSAEPRGAGVRVFRGGQVGFAYTTDLSDDGLELVFDRARENGRYSTPDPANGAAPGWDRAPDDLGYLIDPEQASVSPDAKVAFAVELEKATRALDRRIQTVEEAVYSDSESEVALATSTGIASSYRRTDAWCYAIAIASDDDDTEIGFDFAFATGIAGLDRERVARGAAERATQVLGARKIPSTRLPVVFDPYTSAEFLGVLAGVLTGEAVQKRRSLFEGRVGEQVAAAGLTLFDDGRFAGAPGSRPWDDEGVPTRRTEVIRGGVLSSFLYDTKSARREGRDSTGNASRAGYKSVPGPAPSNLALETTGETRDEVMRRADEALYVLDFHGVHSGANPVSGDFSVGATGVLLERGEPAQPVKEVTIACPMLDILAGIEAVADDRRWLPFRGSYGGATTFVAEMTVGGA